MRVLELLEQEKFAYMYRCNAGFTKGQNLCLCPFVTVLSVSLTRTSSGQGFEVNFFLSEVTIKVLYVLYCYHPRCLFSVFLTAINGALLSLLTYYHPSMYSIGSLVVAV